MTTVVESGLEARIEELTAQVGILVEEIAEQRQRREMWDELRSDLTPVARQLTGTLTDELAGVEISAQDLLSLLIRLGRSAPTLEKGLERLEEASELVGDVSAFGSDITMAALNHLDELEKRGYFTFAAGAMQVLDQVVTSFGEEDLQLLGDNVVLILETLKEMTQPDVMRMLRHTVHAVRVDEDPEKLSTFKLLRELRDPQVKLGMHRMLTAMRAMASPTHEFTEVDEPQHTGRNE